MAHHSRGRTLLVLFVSLMAAGWISSPLGPAIASSPPTFSYLDPDGGEILRGGQTFYIQWNVTHENDTTLPAIIDLSTDDGASYAYPIASGTFTTGGAYYNWTVPTLDTMTARVRVCTWDSGNNSACRVSAAAFTIDSTSPWILWTDPADGATGIPLFRPAQVLFSEAMDTASVSWSVIPAITLIATWPSPDDLVLSPPNGWSACTVYSVRIAGNDLAGNPLVPGAPPAPANPWSFTTDCGNPYIVATVPAAGAQGIPLNATIAVAFSEAMAPTSLVWRFDPPTQLTPVWTGGNTTVTFYHPSAPLAPCTTYLMEIWADDLAGNALVQGPVPNPFYFVTSCGNPYIVATSPVDGERGVLRDDPVVITFSESMNPNTVVVTLTPTVGTVTHWWDTQYTVLTVTHGLFRACTTYVAYVTASDPSGQYLVQGPVPNPWSFQTECGSGATLTLVSPIGGESWTGGTDHSVLYRIDNAATFARTFAVNATARLPPGTQGTLIGARSVTVPPAGTLSDAFSWTLPLVDVTDAVVNVTATEANLTIADEGGPFEIDSTAPSVTSASPTGAQVPLDASLVVDFSEPVAPPPADPLTIQPPVGRIVSWPRADRLVVGLSGLQPCTTYSVMIGAPLRDDSDPGNPLVPHSWSFTTTCAPTVDLLVPVGGEDWTGGSVHDVSWTSSDPDDTSLAATLSYSVDGGATWVVMAALSVGVGPASYAWTLPLLDTAQTVVRIEVEDALANLAVDASPPFTIDSTPPSLIVSLPSHGGTGHKTTRDVWFAWSEAVDRASFVAAFSIAPNPGGLSFSWTVNYDGSDVLVVAHAPFASKTAYAATFAVTARDDSDPGNPLAAPVVVRFTTQPPPPVNPPVAKAVGKNQVQEGEPVTFDGRTSTGNITTYAWRITDNQDRFAAVLRGAVVTYTFHSHGRYHVTLIVTDANGASDEDTIEIAVTSNPAGGLVLGGAILFAAALSMTQSGKFFLVKVLFVPLYARRRKNELLEHQTRGMILGYLMVHPGDTYTHLKTNLLLPNGTLTYHLTVLEREGLIRGQTYGVHKRFFPIGVRVPEDGGGLHEIQMRMLGAIREVPGLAVKDIAGALGITSQLTLYHLRELSTKGLVRLERKGVRLRCFPDAGRPDGKA